MAGEVLLVTQFLAAGLLLLLAGWLLFLNFNGRVVRAFSLFLVLRAMNILSNNLRRLTEAPFDDAYWFGVRGYYDLAVLPVLAFFLLVYTRPRDRGLLRWVGFGLLALTICVELAYAIDHCLALCGSWAFQTVGPLGFLMFAAPFGYAVIGLVAALHARRAASQRARSASFLISAAFFLHAVLEVAVPVAAVLAAGVQEAFEQTYFANRWQFVPLWAFALACIPLLWAAGLYASQAVASHRRHAWLVLGLAIAEVSLAVAIAVVEPSDNVRQLITGTIRMAFPVLVVLAILRHRLFGLDVRIRAGISRGTVAGIILATFFVVSKIAENKVAEWFEDKNAGIYIGGAVAGLLLFAISPLQKVGERVAQATVPSPGKMEREPHAERLRFYQDQAEIAWSDGQLGRRERLLLDQLRERLGLTMEEASKVEHRILAPSRTATKRKADAPMPG